MAMRLWIKRKMDMPKILLVEDNEFNRDMLSRRLIRQGFEVVMAVDGLQGVEMASKEKPDLILMDMSLPGIDGWEATRRIKADAATKPMPVIALTAHAMNEDRAKALAAGCDDFDTKPVDLARLLSKIDQLLEARGAMSNTILPAVTASLPAFKAALDAVCAKYGLSGELSADLLVVLDDVCTNVFKHAYPPDQPGVLRLSLRHLPGNASEPAALEISFTDQGLPFNPLTQALPNTMLSVEDRPLGGLGIHLIRQLTDNQSYSHSALGGNRLSLVKRLP
jgi:CheY-like chemotaxis protein/anti-sigma regulatory factor (Ser/Thr protein kinase)